MFHWCRFGVSAEFSCRPSRWDVLLYVTTFLIILPTICICLSFYHSPYRQLYVWLRSLVSASHQVSADTELVKQLTALNDRRTLDAKQIVKRFEASESIPYASEYFRSARQTIGSWDGEIPTFGEVSESKLTIIIISSRRHKYFDHNFRYVPNYLVQTVVGFWKSGEFMEKSYDGKSIRMVICSTNDEDSAEEQYLGGRLLPLYRTPDYLTELSDTGYPVRPDYDRLAWKYEKEKRDYAFCMREGLRRFPSNYTLLVEDDALPKPEVMHVVDRLISGSWYGDRDELSDASLPERKLYWKLYHPRRLGGFVGGRIYPILQLIGYSITIGSLLFWILNRPQTLAPFFISQPRTLVWGKFCVYSAFVCLAVGRPHLEPWRTIFSPFSTPVHYLVPDAHCCTQAILFTRSAILDLSSFLDAIQCNDTFHKDDALWRWNTGGRHGVEGHLLQPNLFEHIGLFSSVRQGFIDPRLILE